MEDFVSQQCIKGSLSTRIISLKQTHRAPSASYYHAVTPYGDMTLAIEQYSDRIQTQSTQDFLRNRNSLMLSHPSCFPLLYEQQVIINHPQQILCISLMEPCQPISHGNSHQIKLLRSISMEKLVLAGRLLAENGLTVGDFSAEGLLYLSSSSELFFDFSMIRPLEEQQSKSLSLFQATRDAISKILSQTYSAHGHIKEIIFIRDRIYKFNPELLGRATDFYQLLFYLNLLQGEEEVSLQATNRSSINVGTAPRLKQSKVKHLEGSPIIVNQDVQYKNLAFVDGKCTNSLVEVFYEELSSYFIVPNSHYKLKKFQHVVVEITDRKQANPLQQILNKQENSQPHHQSQDQLLTVFPSVTKYEVINFLIAYLKCIEPTIYSIVFNASDNSLQFGFQNRREQRKSLRISFGPSYLVKEEEISIIVEKAKIKKCTLDVRMMHINDAFLMFLANSQKLAKINHLYLSNCHDLTDGSINALLASPHCKGLKTLSITSSVALLQSCMESIGGIKGGLQKLELIACEQNEDKRVVPVKPSNRQEINLTKLKLNQLLSMGLNINLSTLYTSTLKILKINQHIPIEELKNLRGLALTEMKVVLVESPNTKSLFQSLTLPFSNPLSNKQSAARIFAEGASANTLKILDLSGSSIKFKSIHPLFCMNELEKLVLDECRMFGGEFDSVSPRILYVSLINLGITVDQLITLLHKTSALVELNVVGTKIGKKQLIQFLSQHKKYVSNLKISEGQYSNKLLDTTRELHMTKTLSMKEKPHIHRDVFQSIESIEILVDRLLYPEQENQFDYLLYKASKTNKTLRLVVTTDLGVTGNSSYDQLLRYSQEKEIETKRSRLMAKLSRYLDLAPEDLASLKNLYIENMRALDIFQMQGVAEWSNTGQIFTDLSTNSALNKIKSISQQQNQQSSCFLVEPLETIDKVTHRFVKFTAGLPEHSMITVDLRNNRVVGSAVISMMKTFAQNQIQKIDFRGCLFGFDEVSDELYEMPYLRELNGCSYSVSLNKENFIKQSQKCLKFFMKVIPIRRLDISCEDTEEIEILYSVLYHILEQHESSIERLSVKFTRLTINFESELFLDKIFGLKMLSHLEIELRDCKIVEEDSRITNLFKNKFRDLQARLTHLNIMVPFELLPTMQLRMLEKLVVSFSDLEAQQAAFYKKMKHLTQSPALKYLSISLSNATNFSNLSKAFSGVSMPGSPKNSFLDKLQSLESLYLDFEYCPLKEQTVFELIESLSRCQRLKFVQINLSFAVVGLNELLESVEQFLQAPGRAACMRVICVTYRQSSSKFVFNKEEMHQKGAQFIL